MLINRITTFNVDEFGRRIEEIKTTGKYKDIKIQIGECRVSGGNILFKHYVIESPLFKKVFYKFRQPDGTFNRLDIKG